MSFYPPLKNSLPSQRPTVVRLGQPPTGTFEPRNMVAYHPSICGPDGRFDHEAFRSAFLRSLQQFQYNPSPFFLPLGSPPLVLPSSCDSSMLRRDTSEVAPFSATAEGEDALEELSDIEDDDASSASSTCSATGGGAVGPDASYKSSRITSSVGSTVDGDPKTACMGRMLSSPSTVSNTPRVKIVFDLDNTLLHAQSKYKLNSAELNLDDFRDSMNRPEMYRFTLPRQKNQAYFIKFRPGVREFISEVSKYCDLAIHTNATREYADVVMSIIDPDRSLFGARVAARNDESGQNDRKDMSRLFGSDRERQLQELLILDDRRDVWDQVFEKNIIQCNYYEYFESRKELLTRKYNSLAANGSLQKDDAVVDVIDSYMPENYEAARDQDQTQNSNGLEDLDRQLYFLRELVVNVVKTFYRHARLGKKKSIATILQEYRSTILSDCVVLMTGYHKLEAASQLGMLDNGPQHRRRLEHMGAKVVEAPSPEVTHVLVMRQTVSTDRARSLCGPNTKFVHNLWIYACEQTWTKVDEDLFEASQLLLKWQKPPTRPMFEHWTYTKQFYDSLTAKINTDSAADTTSGTSSSPASSDGEEGTLEDPGVTRLPDMASSELRRKRRFSESTMQWNEGDPLFKKRVTLDPRAYPIYNSTAATASIPTQGSGAASTVPSASNANGTASSALSSNPEISTREWIATGHFSDGAEVWSCTEHIILKYDPFVSSTLQRKTALLNM